MMELTMRSIILFAPIVYLVVSIVLSLSSSSSFVSCYNDSSYDDLKQLDALLKKYDRRMIPTYNQPDVPTLVSCEFFVRSIGSVNPLTMDYEVDLYLRQSWIDTRLKSFNLSRALDLSDPKLVQAIWKPEVFFANAKHAAFQYVTVPNVMLRIFPSGQIFYLLRLKLTFACMMDLSKYPFDTQVCTMEMASFSKTTNELILGWTPNEPIRLVKDLKLPQYEITQIHTSNCSASFHRGEYSCIVVELFLKRSIGFHLLETYLPTILIIIVSWLSFYLDVEAVPARITLGITTLLTMSFKGSSIQDKLPQVSYIKAIDVWMGTCTAFVFAAVLEFTFVNCKCRNQVASEAETKENSLDNKKLDPKINKQYAARFDSISRVVFPLVFLFFNLVYWPYYLYIM